MSLKRKFLRGPDESGLDPSRGSYLAQEWVTEFIEPPPDDVSGKDLIKGHNHLGNNSVIGYDEVVSRAIREGRIKRQDAEVLEPFKEINLGELAA